MPYKDPIKNLAYERARYWKHHAERKAYASRWREANRAKLRIQQRGYRLKHREKQRAHERLMASARNAYHRAYYHRNREKFLLRSRQRYAANAEKFRAQRRAEYARNPEPFIVSGMKRRAQKRGVSGASITTRQWTAIKAHYRDRCVYCRRKMQRLTMDHIVPLSKGGRHAIDNIVPACQSCNSRKGARAPLVPVQPLLLLG